tara:strand:- start:261 stop:500 length:240 start_codon:yes stop_codon:yes gene_type:complete
MSNKIIKTTEKYVVTTTEKRILTSLPDGNYIGKWGGYIITVNYRNKTYECKTESGVRGVGYTVVVNVKDGESTFIEIDN